MAIRINASGEKMKQLTSWCLDGAAVSTQLNDVFVECGVMVL